MDPESAGYGAPPLREARRLAVEATLRTLVTVTLLVALYYLLPLDRRMDAVTIAQIAIGCLVLAAVIGWQIRTIGRSPHPGARAVEELAFTLPLYLLLFATTYFVMAGADPAYFSEPMTRTDALYFSVTTFTTVGFGDIAAKGQSARLLVTVQMTLDLLLLGLVVRLFLNAVRRSQHRQAAPQADEGPRR